MLKELEKFVKDLILLESYCVLASSNDEIIVGTLLNFTEVNKIGGGAYSFHGIIEQQIKKTWPVYFVISFSKAKSTFSGKFSCPVFYLSKEKAAHKNKEELQRNLEKFLTDNF